MPTIKTFPSNVLAQLTKADPEIEIDQHITTDGDVCFKVPMEAAGISRASWNKTALLRTRFMLDFLGELLVRRNLDQFMPFLHGLDPTAYQRRVNCFKHKKFGYKVDGDFINFRFHISLVQRVLVEDMGEMLSARSPK